MRFEYTFYPDNPEVLWDLPAADLLVTCRTVLREEKDVSHNIWLLRPAGLELAESIWAIEVVEEIHYCFKIRGLVVSSGPNPLSAEDHQALAQAFLKAAAVQPKPAKPVVRSNYLVSGTEEVEVPASGSSTQSPKWHGGTGYMPM